MENNNNSGNGRKRIAMFSIHSDPLASLGSQESGGQNIYIRHLAEELEKFGWIVDIFTRWDSAYKKQIAPITKHTRVIRLKGGPTKHIPKNELFPLLPEIFNNFLVFIDFKNPYDIFHGHYWDGGWMARQAHLKFRKPLVHNFHSLGIVRRETKKQYLKNGNEKDYFLKRLTAEKEIIESSSVIISLAQTELKNLNEFYGCPVEKIKVIPGAINLKHWPLIEKNKARERLGIKPEEFVILFVGRLEWRKGIGTLISAAKLLREELPNLKVLIVGGKIFGRNKNMIDFKEYKRLEEKAKEEGIKDIVVFTGNIENRSLPVYYRAADVFAIPSYYEPFGLVALEGMASETPVVASRVDGLSRTIKDGENGLLFAPRNAFDLKEKIVLIYKSKDLALKLTENARKDVANNYSWGRVAEQISQIYNNLIKKNENA